MAYNAFNSLSPMMFKKQAKKDKEGTRNERWRSKSVEHVFDTVPQPPKQRKSPVFNLRSRASTSAAAAARERESADRQRESASKWKELDRLKSLAPVVACVLPSLAMDFVASALLAVGATPLVTEDPADMANDLTNCKAVVVDVSAPQVILEAFMESYDSMKHDIPFILVASTCGINNRKKNLAVKILEEYVPTVVTGRLGDIYAVSQTILEKNVSPLDSLSDMSDSDEESSTQIPRVILSRDSRSDMLASKQPDITAGLPASPSSPRATTDSPVSRRARMRNRGRGAASPPPPSLSNGSSTPSPVTSRPPTASPRTSPRASPVTSPRGVRKMLQRKNKKETSGLVRVPTALPRVMMKGQFRETQMGDVSVDTALEHAQRLCVYTSSFVHLYEANVVTSGEVVVEIANTQLGMGNLHSTLPCSAAVMAAVLACVNLEEDNVDSFGVKHCGHALALYYVAGDEAGAAATSKSEKCLVSPGTLRESFLDALHYLDEMQVHQKVQICAHTEGLKASLN